MDNSIHDPDLAQRWTGLSPMAETGHVCVLCGRDLALTRTPAVPCGRSNLGQVFACETCAPEVRLIQLAATDADGTPPVIDLAARRKGGE